MLCPHLHISLQHGSQAVLKRMGRGHYTPAMLENAVSVLSAHWPVMGLGADIIAGFPGETEDDMRLLLELIERLSPELRARVSLFAAPRHGGRPL